MPTLAATLSLNVPAITGLLAGVTIPAVTNNLSSTQFYYGQTALTNLTANSANWQSAYTTLSANSANWNQQISNLYSSLATSVQPYSGVWNQTTTTLSANSASWVGTYTTLNSNSGVWNQTTTCVSQNAGIWGGASSSTAVVAANSANWGNASSTVQAYSGAWDLSIIGSVTAKGPYTVINTSTIIPISGFPFGYGGNYNVTLGGLNNTNSGCYNVLVGGNRNYLSAGCYNFIGNGGYNRIGGFNTSTVCNNITLRDNGLTYNNAAVLSGNGSCTRIFDAQGGNYSSSVLVGDTIGIAYTTTSSPSLSSVTTATTFTSGVVVAVNPTDNNQCYGSIVISGRDLSTCTGNGVSARGLYLYDITYNNSCIGSTVVGGNLNTASGNYSTVGGGSYNTALSSSTVAGGCTNFAANNSFIGGGTGNFACNPYSVITAGGFNKIGGGCIVSSTSVLSSNNSCTLVCFANQVCTNNFSNYDPINVVCIGSNGLAAATVAQATIVGKNLTANSTTSLSSILITGNLSAANSIWIVDKNTSSTNIFNTVGGGALNTASGCYSVVAGGFNNSATGNGSFIAGGTGNTASGNYTFVLGSGINGTASNTTYTNNLNTACINATQVLVNNPAGDSRIEIGGNGSVYLDLKNPNSDNYDVRLATDGTNAFINTIVGPLYINSDNSQNVILGTGGGNVGINTITPKQTLTVTGTISASGGLSASNISLGSGTAPATLNVSPLTIVGAANGSIFNSIQNTVAGVSASTDVSLYNNDGVNYLDLGIASTSYNGNLYSPVFNVVNGGDSYVYATNNNLVMGAAGAAGNVTFFTGGTLSGSQGNERMRITPSGNIGIGTTSPGATLTVNGAVSASGNITSYSINAQSISATAGPGNGISWADRNNSGYANQWYRNNAVSYFYDNSPSAPNSGNLIAITSGGNVGIGTSLPGATLTVAGSISASNGLSANNIYGSGNQTVLTDGSNTTGNGANTISLNYSQGTYIGLSGTGNLYALNVPQYTVLLSNSTAATSAAVFSGTLNPYETIAAGGIYEIEYFLPHSLSITGSLTASVNFYLSANNLMGSVASSLYQRVASSSGGSGSYSLRGSVSTGTSSLLNMGANIPSAPGGTYTYYVNGTTGQTDIKVLINNSTNSYAYNQALIIVASSSSGSVSALINAYKKVTRIK